MIDSAGQTRNMNLVGLRPFWYRQSIYNKGKARDGAMVKAVGQRVGGRLLWEDEAGQDGRLALLLTHPQPEQDAANTFFLRFAFVIMGPETPLFPSFLIDDWGGEVRGRALYEWVQENGNHFPRAEIFGFDQHGASVQYFVRELELYAKLPAYVYPDRETPLPEGKLLNAILLPDEAVEVSQKIKRPSHLKRPLASAQVNWWQVPATLSQFDFNSLDEPQAF
jgi:hypothetical protein